MSPEEGLKTDFPEVPSMVKDGEGVWRAGDVWKPPPPEPALHSRQARGGLTVLTFRVDEPVTCQPGALLSAPLPSFLLHFLLPRSPPNKSPSHESSSQSPLPGDHLK